MHLLLLLASLANASVTSAPPSGSAGTFDVGPCGATQYIGGSTVLDGIVTGGTCTDDAGGAGAGETNTFTTSSKTFGQANGNGVALYISSGNILAINRSTATLFNIAVTSMIFLNSNQPHVFNSSGVIGYWMINQSSRAIKAGETVQDSSGTLLSPQGVIGTIALATTTIMGVSIDNIPINGWGRIAVAGFVQTWCGIAANCRKGWRVQAAGGAAATIGRATGATAPAAASDIGTWMESTAINAQGWVRLGR